MKKLILLGVVTLSFSLLFSQQTEVLYNSSELSINTPMGDVFGTLLSPKVIKKNTPLVIIIAGSGNTDRDGNQPQMKNNSLI
jgi:hypothetical protein